jgi:hypothetical protein
MNMITKLLNIPCTISQPSSDDDGPTDVYGNPTGGDPTVTETVCELQQQRRTEPDADGELSDTTWLLVLPAGTQLDTAATVIVNDTAYEVVGDPWPARNPRTRREHHIEATVRRTA